MSNVHWEFFPSQSDSKIDSYLCLFWPMYVESLWLILKYRVSLTQKNWVRLTQIQPWLNNWVNQLVMYAIFLFLFLFMPAFIIFPIDIFIDACITLIQNIDISECRYFKTIFEIAKNAQWYFTMTFFYRLFYKM